MGGCDVAEGAAGSFRCRALQDCLVRADVIRDKRDKIRGIEGALRG